MLWPITYVGGGVSEAVASFVDSNHFATLTINLIILLTVLVIWGALVLIEIGILVGGVVVTSVYLNKASHLDEPRWKIAVSSVVISGLSTLAFCLPED